MTPQDEIVAEFTDISSSAQALAARFFSEPVKSSAAHLLAAIQDADAAASGSWLGYHSRIYIEDFNPRSAADYFDRMNGPGGFVTQTRGRWRIYEEESVKNLIFQSVEPDVKDVMEALAEEAREFFTDKKSSFAASLDALLSRYKDRPLKVLREELESLESHVSASDFIRIQRPRNYVSGDQAALAEGPQVPPHKQVHAWLLQWESHAAQLKRLALLARKGATYVDKKSKLSTTGVLKHLRNLFGDERLPGGLRQIRAGKKSTIFAGDVSNSTVQQANNALPGGDITFASGAATIGSRTWDDSAMLEQAQFNKEVAEILHLLTDAKEELEEDRAQLVQFFASLLAVSTQGKTIGQLKSELAERLRESQTLPALRRLSDHATPISQGIVSNILYTSLVQPILAALSTVT